jgi:hypothetical protein
MPSDVTISLSETSKYEQASASSHPTLVTAGGGGGGGRRRRPRRVRRRHPARPSPRPGEGVHLASRRRAARFAGDGQLVPTHKVRYLTWLFSKDEDHLQSACATKVVMSSFSLQKHENGRVNVSQPFFTHKLSPRQAPAMTYRLRRTTARWLKTKRRRNR